MALALPHFLGIGSIRCGTVWLWKQLQKHPDIWMPNTKELHFFNRNWERKIPQLPQDTERKLRYSSHFAMGKIRNPQSTIGEFTPAYAILPSEKIATVHAWVPNAKLIFLVRDPVERTWSQVIRKFHTKEGLNLEEMSNSEIIERIEQTGIYAQSQYAENLVRWLQYFPRQQIYVSSSSSFLEIPQQAIQNIFTFLGVDPNPPINWASAMQKTHTGPSIPLPPEIESYLQEEFGNQQQKLSELLGQQIEW